jgi:hypothetical protein
VRFIKFETSVPTEIHQLASYTIAFVPTEMEMAVNDSRMGGTGLLIAVKYKDASDWKFLDVSQMSRDEITDFYSELPKDCAISSVKIEIKK